MKSASEESAHGWRGANPLQLHSCQRSQVHLGIRLALNLTSSYFSVISSYVSNMVLSCMGVFSPHCLQHSSTTQITQQPTTTQRDVYTLLELCGELGGETAPLCLTGEQSSTSAFRTVLLMPALSPPGILLNLREDSISSYFTLSLFKRFHKKNSLLEWGKGARLTVTLSSERGRRT